MSIESMAVVLHHSKAGGTDKLVLLGIANHDGDGGAWPSIATLARYANVAPRQVQKCLRRLEEAGEIMSNRQAGGLRNTPDHNRPNLYFLKVTCPPECDRTAQHRITRAAAPVSYGTPPVLADTPTPVLADTPPVSQRTPKPPTNHPLNADESSFRSTSPAAAGSLCWACGEPHGKKTRYCTGCSSRGLNSPIINCKHEDCGNTGKRVVPGQQSFDCGGH